MGGHCMTLADCVAKVELNTPISMWNTGERACITTQNVIFPPRRSMKKTLLGDAVHIVDGLGTFHFLLQKVFCVYLTHYDKQQASAVVLKHQKG